MKALQIGTAVRRRRQALPIWVAGHISPFWRDQQELLQTMQQKKLQEI
jgi:hypothetical protein